MRILLAGVLAIAAAFAATPKSEVADAAQRGDKSAVRALLQKKTDVNAQQVDGTSALHWAVEANDAELVDLLLRNGAKASAVNKAVVSHLLLATENGNASMIGRLLAAGA